MDSPSNILQRNNVEGGHVFNFKTMQLKLKYGLGLLVVLIVIYPASGQSPAIDSILTLIANARDYTSKIMLNIRAADIMRGYDVDRAMKHIEAIHPIVVNLD